MNKVGGLMLPDFKGLLELKEKYDYTKCRQECGETNSYIMLMGI